jgi:hypothetical protein
MWRETHDQPLLRLSITRATEMSSDASQDRRFSPFKARQIAAAARAAAAIGGPTPDADLDPSQRPLVEAGEGVA